MDIFDAMINGNSNDGLLFDRPSRDQQNNKQPADTATSLPNQQAPSTPLLQSRHFPVLKIVEPGDSDAVPPLTRKQFFIAVFIQLT